MTQHCDLQALFFKLSQAWSAIANTCGGAEDRFEFVYSLCESFSQISNILFGLIASKMSPIYVLKETHTFINRFGKATQSNHTQMLSYLYLAFRYSRIMLSLRSGSVARSCVSVRIIKINNNQMKYRQFYITCEHLLCLSL